MRRVRCPRCNAVIPAAGDSVKCTHCGLAGRVDGGPATPAGAAAKREPWTFTVDLRKLAPRNWSSGTKAFSVLLLLGLVFAAGGASGVAFERARSEIASDLDQGGSLLGGDSGQAPSSQVPYVPPDSPSQPPPENQSQPPENQSQPPENQSQPPASDAEDPQVAYRGITGEGGAVPGPFELPAGLVQLTISYHGDTKFFSVKLHLEADRPELRVDASDSGSLFGTIRYGSLSQPGQYYIHTNAAEGETWEIDLVVPDEDAQDSSFSLAGNGDGGVGPFRFSGSHSVTFDNPSPWSYDVRIFDGAGNRLACSFAGSSGSTTKTCTAAVETLVYFDIRIKGSDDDWRLTAEGA